MSMTILKRAIEFLRSEEGPTAVEYAVMLMLIFAVVITTIQVLGLATKDSFEQSRDQIIKAVNSD